MARGPREWEDWIPSANYKIPVAAMRGSQSAPFLNHIFEFEGFIVCLLLQRAEDSILNE